MIVDLLFSRRRRCRHGGGIIKHCHVPEEGDVLRGPLAMAVPDDEGREDLLFLLRSSRRGHHDPDAEEGWLALTADDEARSQDP
eukprot:CAMPEP_0118915488 /NCGR_PEP_ID=MMETSP1166-20130328/15645_1 /TAXON_ID=1104430 /ORGANISM="Chrysoreinhardia sp, Strain CCMP3193" /LENGTH=83 /DNA_ID=CAMNT_0006855187 /DNA_START=62 /DNA_END=313 /DNA_ORIENTATION=+